MRITIILKTFKTNSMRKKLFITALTFMVTSGCFAGIFPFSEQEEWIYAENAEALNFRGNAVGSDALEELVQKYCVLTSDAGFLKKLFVEREIRKATYDYMDYKPWDKMLCKQRIDSLYQDSINARLIPYNPSVAGEVITMAVRLSKSVGASPETKGRIVALGLDVARRKRLNPNYFYDKEIMDSLRTFLKKDQLVRILVTKNSDAAKQKAVRSWENAVREGLVVDEDSVDAIDKARDYYTSEGVINDLYVGHESARMKNLSALWKRQPLLVRMDGAIQRKADLKNRKEEESKTDNNLEW